MAKVKYRVGEYTPTENQMGTHSWYAESVITNEIDNVDLAELVAARTGYKSYECQSIIAAVADIIHSEVLKSHRVSLSTEKGVKIVSIYPKVQGSVSDADIERETTAKHALDPNIPIRTKAQESDLTSDRLSWKLGARVGVKFSQLFAIEKQAQRVKVTTENVTTLEPEEEDATQDPDDEDNHSDNGGGSDTGGNNGGSGGFDTGD